MTYFYKKISNLVYCILNGKKFFVISFGYFAFLMRASLVHGAYQSLIFIIFFPLKSCPCFPQKISECCIVKYLKSIFLESRSDASVSWTIKIYFCNSHHFWKAFSIKLVRKRKSKQSDQFHCSTNYYLLMQEQVNHLKGCYLVKWLSFSSP